MDEYMICGLILAAVVCLVVGIISPMAGYALLLIGKPIIDRLYSAPLVDYDTVTPSAEVSMLQYFALFSMLYLVVIALVKRFSMAALKHFALFIIFIAVGAIAILTTEQTQEYKITYAAYAYFIITAMYAYNLIKKTDDILYISRAIIASTIFPTACILYSFVMNQAVVIGETDNIKRYIGGYFHMSIVSCTLMTAVPAYIYIIIKDKFSLKIASIAMLIAMTVSIYLTGYRTATLGTLSIIGLFYALNLSATTRIALIVAIWVLFTTISFTEVDQAKRYSETLIAAENIEYLNSASAQYDKLLSGRFGAYRKYIRMALQNPEEILFGGGAIFDKIITIHSSVFQIILQHGLIAFMIFVAFCVQIANQIRNMPRNDIYKNILIGFFITFITVGLTRGYFFDTRTTIYVSIYLAIIYRSHSLAKPV